MNVFIITLFNLFLISPQNFLGEDFFWYYILIGIIILIIFTVVIYFFLEIRFKKLLKENVKKELIVKEQTEKIKQKTLLENQVVLNLEKEQLSQQIKEKTIELAIKAKEDEDKIRLLHTIKDKILEAEENPNVYKIRLKEMRRLLDHYLEIDNKTFEIQMDELHHEFFVAMKKKFPNLSIYDLRLCAYLRIGLNSREMADILQVLPSSINVSRSRLRKKLGLTHQEDLFEFLNQF